MESPQANAVTDEPTKRKRRWYQFSLRAFLIVTLLCGCLFGLVARERQKAAKHKAAVEAIQSLPGTVKFDSEKPGRSAWLKLVLGDDSFANVREVIISYGKVTDADLVHLEGLTQLKVLQIEHTQITDAGLVHLRGLTQLQYLSLSGTQVTDAGLNHLGGMPQLQYLSLGFTQVTDAGLVHLRGLTQLQTLSLPGAQVTNGGVQELKAALPNCLVSR